MNVLEEIVATKRDEVDRAKGETPESSLRQKIADAPPARDFLAALLGGRPLRVWPDFLALRNTPGRVPLLAKSGQLGTACRKRSAVPPSASSAEAPGNSPASSGTPESCQKIWPHTSIRLIAEVKKASPSRGVIRADFDPVAIARTYERHGAACISVLTDAPYFQGSLENLRRVRAAVSLPVLRKDFIVDPYQVVEARANGADAVLLIAECLDDAQLRRLYDGIIELGMTPLVELHEAANLDRVLRLGARLIGINNRDLRTFAVDLGHTIRLRSQIPNDRIVVAESGIRTPGDVEQLEAAGVQAMLVGESLLSKPDIGAAVDALRGAAR